MRRHRESEFDRWIGDRVIVYLILAWVVGIYYGLGSVASLALSMEDSFYVMDYAFLMMLPSIGIYILLVGLDYLAFRVHEAWEARSK